MLAGTIVTFSDIDTQDNTIYGIFVILQKCCTLICFQADCSTGPSSDKQNFAALVQELSDVFKPRGLLLTAAVSPNKEVIDAGYDVPTLNKYLDYIYVMAYDYYGAWDTTTGHNSPLYDYDGGNPSFSVVSMKYLTSFCPIQ